MKAETARRFKKSWVVFGFFYVILFSCIAAHAAPVIRAIPDQSVPEDNHLTLTVSVDDAVSATLTLTATSSNAAIVPQGNISLTGSDASRLLTIVPLADQSGVTQIQISALDGTGTDTEDFTLTVAAINDPPAITAPATQETDEGDTLTFGTASNNAIAFSDIDAGTNEVEALIAAENGLLTTIGNSGAFVTGNNSEALVLRGTLAEINAALNGMTYTPEPYWNGTENLTVRIDDLGHSGGKSNPFEGDSQIATRKIAVTVKPINDPPSVSGPESATTPEDTPIIFSLGTENRITVSDRDAGDNPIRVTVAIDKGLLGVDEEFRTRISGNNMPEISFEADTDTANEILDGLTCRVGPVHEQTVLGSISRSVEKDWHGDAVLTLTVNDQGHSGAGGPLSVSRTVDIQVTPVNDPPVITLASPAPTINEDGTLSFSGTNAVSVKDADAGSQSIQITLDLADGQLTLPDRAGVSIQRNGDRIIEVTGSLTDINAALAALVFTPSPNWNGETSMAATANDKGFSGDGGPLSAQKTITITVRSVNDAPVLQGEAPFILTPIEPNATDPEGTRISQILQNRILDADTGTAAAGVAVVLADTDHGEWQYSIDDGEVWLDFGDDLSDTSATLLSREALIRFTPDADWEGIAALGFRLWDGSDDGDNGAVGVNLGATGGSTAFSGETGAIRITVGSPPTLTANAGADQTAMEGQTVTLDGTGSEWPEDITPVVTWTQEAGPSVSLSNIHAIQPFFIAPEIGIETVVLRFRISLTAEGYDPASDAVQVTVSPDLTITANAGPDQTVTEGATVTLNGAGSTVPQGMTALYQWTQTEGETAALSNSSAAETSFIAPDVADNQQKILTFQLTVGDNTGAETDRDSVVIRVNSILPVNIPPVANAGPTQNVTPGTLVTLSGAGSTDADGAIVSYQWRELTNASIGLSTPNAVTTTFTAPSGGAGGKTLRFELTVTDNSGLTAIAAVTVNVAPDSVSGPISTQSFESREGETVTLTGTPSSEFGTPVAYLWTQVSGIAVTLSDTRTASPTFVPPPETVGRTLVFDAAMTNARGETQTARFNIQVIDNGVTGYPDGVITFRPTADATMGILVHGNAKLVKLQPVDPSQITDTPNRPENLLYGLISMVIRAENIGDTVTAAVYLQNPAPASYRWYTHDETAGWRDYSANATFNEDRTRIELKLIDGATGDSDRNANRMIQSIAGLGTSPSSGGENSGDGGDGDSNCFIHTLMTGK